MNLEHMRDRSLAEVAQDRIERREFGERIEARRAYVERKTKGKVATAYCLDSADAQFLIDYAEMSDLYLDRVLKEFDKKLTKRFSDRYTAGSLCNFLAAKNADHVILSGPDVFIDFRDFVSFVWLCRKAQVKIHFLKPAQYRFWRFTFTLFS
jgi:hypothetical protein